VPAVKGFSFRPLKCQSYKKSPPPPPDGSKYTYIEWHTTGKQVSFRCMHVHTENTLCTHVYMSCELILSGAFGEQLKLKFHTHDIDGMGKCLTWLTHK